MIFIDDKSWLEIFLCLLGIFPFKIYIFIFLSDDFEGLEKIVEVFGDVGV